MFLKLCTFDQNQAVNSQKAISMPDESFINVENLVATACMQVFILFTQIFYTWKNQASSSEEDSSAEESGSF